MLLNVRIATYDPAKMPKSLHSDHVDTLLKQLLSLEIYSLCGWLEWVGEKKEEEGAYSQKQNIQSPKKKKKKIPLSWRPGANKDSHITKVYISKGSNYELTTFP